MIDPLDDGPKEVVIAILENTSVEFHVRMFFEARKNLLAIGKSVGIRWGTDFYNRPIIELTALKESA